MTNGQKKGSGCRILFFCLCKAPAALQPVASQIIDDEHNRGYRPGQRIAECHRRNLRTERDNHENPDDAQDADTEAGKEHGNDGIPAASCRTPQYLDTDISDIARGNDGHHMKPDVDNTVVRGKQPEENPPSQQNDGTEQNTGKSGHTQADLDAFMDSVVFAGTEILTCKSSNCHAIGAHDHPENPVNLSVCGPCGNRIRTERVDAGLDDQVGNGIHGGLQPGRQPYTDDMLQNPRRKPDFRTRSL